MKHGPLSWDARAELRRVVAFAPVVGDELADSAARLLYVDSMLRSLETAASFARRGILHSVVCASLLLALVGVGQVEAQALPTGCTGTAQLMKCEWAIDAKQLGPGVHTLSFTITEANGATVRHSLSLSISSVMLSEATHSARAVAFKLESPAGITAIADATMDGQPFALAAPAP